MMSGKEHLQYQTGKIVRNWAQTFECQPERFYYPKSEDDIVEVLPTQEIAPAILALLDSQLMLDCESCKRTWEICSSCWSGALAVRHSLFLRMDDVTGPSQSSPQSRPRPTENNNSSGHATRKIYIGTGKTGMVYG